VHTGAHTANMTVIRMNNAAHISYCNTVKPVRIILKIPTLIETKNIFSYFIVPLNKIYQMVEASAKLKLYYYPAQGAAQQIRFTLVAGGIAFDDVPASSFPPSPEDKALWVRLGQNTTTNIPMLVEGENTVYTQSLAVLRVAARRGGLMPTDVEEVYQVDKLIADVADLRAASYKAIAMMGATPAAQAHYVHTVLPQHVGNLERQLGDNEYFVGGQLSVADTAIYDVLTTKCRNLVPDYLSAYPKLEAFVQRIEGLETIAEYRKSDAFTKLMAFPAIKLE